MINARELRIGNLVLLDGKHTATVTAIEGDNITTKNPHNKYVDGYTGDVWDAKNDFIKPIPLTAEWLTANDFVDTADSYYRRSIQNEDTLSPTMLVISRGFAEIARSGIGAVAAPCKYVHQLQNLFFALTGQELTIKEKV